MVFQSWVLVDFGVIIGMYCVCCSIIMSDIMSALPISGSGFWSNGGGPGSTGILSSNSEIFDWLGQVVLPSIFQVTSDSYASSLSSIKFR